MVCSCTWRGRQIWPDILSQILLCGWERLLAVGLLLCAPPAGGKHPCGDASQKIQLHSEQMLSVHGFAPPAPGRGWKENWEMVLEKYGQKWSRPGKEQPYGRCAAGSVIKPSARDARGLAVLSWEPGFLCVPPCYDSDQKFHFWPENSSRWKFNYKSDVFPQETSVSANKYFFLKNYFIHTHKNLAPTNLMLEH